MFKYLLIKFLSFLTDLIGLFFMYNNPYVVAMVEDWVL